MKRLLLPAIALGLLATVGTAQSAPLTSNVGKLPQATPAAQQVDKIGWRRHHGWHKHRWHRRWHRRHHGWWGYPRRNYGWWGYPRRHYGWWGDRRHHYWR